MAKALDMAAKAGLPKLKVATHQLLLPDPLPPLLPRFAVPSLLWHGCWFGCLPG